MCLLHAAVIMVGSPQWWIRRKWWNVRAHTRVLDDITCILILVWLLNDTRTAANVMFCCSCEWIYLFIYICRYVYVFGYGFRFIYMRWMRRENGCGSKDSRWYKKDLKLRGQMLCSSNRFLPFWVVGRKNNIYKKIIK